MKENSKIPAWLQDRKKMIILGIVLLAMIASAANTFTLSRIITGKLINNTGIKQSVVHQVENAFKSNKLDGTYENIYANESLMFSKNGSLIYTFEDQIEFGNYEIKDNYLTLTLGDYDYQFIIEENSRKQLVIYDGSYKYVYEKQ